jgi:hypothetical protein
MMGGERVIDYYGASAAHSVSDAARRALASLFDGLGTTTEPNFAVIGPAYNKVLAMAMLLAGAFIALALTERILGGSRGAGWDVLSRTLLACLTAFAGLGIVEYVSHYASLLPTVWSSDFILQGTVLAHQIQAIYSRPIGPAQALGNWIGLLIVALLTFFLVILVYVELVLRAALILVTATFIPLVSVMAIWPRLSGAASHLAQFLLMLFLSKFVIVTALYVGFAMVAQGLGTPEGSLVGGLAILLIALFSPVVLLQGLRFAEAGTSHLVRGWGATAVRALSTASGLRIAGKPLGGLAGARLGQAGRKLSSRVLAFGSHVSKPPSKRE